MFFLNFLTKKRNLVKWNHKPMFIGRVGQVIFTSTVVLYPIAVGLREINFGKPVSLLLK